MNPESKEQLNQEVVETPVEQPETEVQEGKVQETATTFTEDDVLKRVQSETDKVRTEYSKKIKKLEARIAELAPTLSPAEEEVKRRLDELEEKQKLVESKEELLNLQTHLTEMNLPKSLVTYLNGNCDVGEFAKVIDSIVIERNKGLGYQPTPHINSDGLTQEKWSKMPYSERVELYNSNPELYSKFMK